MQKISVLYESPTNLQKKVASKEERNETREKESYDALNGNKKEINFFDRRGAWNFRSSHQREVFYEKRCS